MKYALSTLLLLSALVAVRAQNPGVPISEVNVYPADVNLTTLRDKQSFIVQATYADGITCDVTSQAKVSVANAALVKLDKNVLTPVADGATEMKVEFGGKTVPVKVTVKDAKVDPPISFKLDVMPVFMRWGCNSGACHGAARGKDGFRLSLFGYDPDGDHYRLTREINGRRINLALPAESLLLEKATGKVPHTGGQRFDDKSERHETIVRWLEAGAPADPPTVATPVGIDLYPKGAVLDGKGEKQQLVVRARYSDGTERDVTPLTLFLSNNDNSAKVAEDGSVTAGDRGEAFVMARFHTYTVGVPFVVLPKGLKFDFPKVPENNYIDTLVNAKLKKLRIAPSELCTDEAFLRRVYVDIIGVLPTAEEHDRFLNDKAPNKREKLVD